MKTAPVVDYRTFRLRKLNTPPFSHLKLLLFWPIFGLLFAFVERVGVTQAYTPVHCFLDDLIPFCEWFLLPYLFWFIYLVGIHAYTLLWDVKSFRKMMYFIILTYGVTMVIYLLFPTCQELRPETFARDNILTRFTAKFYAFDTNTNVCPSIHVIGSVAVMAAAWHSRHFSTAGWRWAFTAMTVLISISTVFMKQHSVLDVFAAIPICAGAWVLVYKLDFPKNFRKTVERFQKKVYNSK